jgi:uncharacterized protein (DUF983 family)
MTAIAAAGAGFLIAVLWFDLMFDVQTRQHNGELLPAEVLDSIAAYYKRVTTDARPMSYLVSSVMLVTLLAILGQLITQSVPLWLGLVALMLVVSAVGLAASRTVKSAVRLGRQSDSPAQRTQLARGIYRDHVFCLAAMISVLLLELGAKALG